MECCSDKSLTYCSIDDLRKFECEKDKKKKEKYIYSLLIIFVIFIAVIIVGAIIFKYLFDIPWIDAFYAATLILTGIDIEVNVTTVGQKIFIIIYALLTVLLLLSMANVAVQYLFNLFD